MARYTATLFILLLVIGAIGLGLLFFLRPSTHQAEVKTAVLLSRSKYKDYEKSTFSFEHGVRDDPGHAITRNDWDLMYGNGLDHLTVTMVVDDRSRILDLGAKSWRSLNVGSLPILLPHPTPTKEPYIPAVEGHMYLVRTADGDSDLLALFRVDKLVPGDRCELSWTLVGE